MERKRGIKEKGAKKEETKGEDRGEKTLIKISGYTTVQTNIAMNNPYDTKLCGHFNTV